jgi:hypothetical protein
MSNYQHQDYQGLPSSNYGVKIQNFIGLRGLSTIRGKITSVPNDLPADLNFIKIDQDIEVGYVASVSYDNNPQYATTRVGVGSGENFKLLINNKISTIVNVSSINILMGLGGYHYIIIKYDTRNIYIPFRQRL